MQGTELFKQTIQNYLDRRAKEDAQFGERYANTTRTIEDVVTFILNQVKASGCNGFSDDEIFGMAVHCIDEPELEIGNPLDCYVSINRHVALTEEEKAEMRAQALKRFQDEELSKIRQRNERKAQKRTESAKTAELSLFDL